MRIHVASDYHLDVAPYHPAPVECDVRVDAGDVCEGLEGAVSWLRGTTPPGVPVVAVPGNHSFYGRCLPDELAAGRYAALQLPEVYLLEDSSVVVGEVRFVGATLWTDYALAGPSRLLDAMVLARRAMNDHSRVAWSVQPSREPLDPVHLARLHARTVAYLERELSRRHTGPTCVVTHHLPHPRSVAPRYAGQLLNAAFASDLSELIDWHAPELWVHGHTHTGCDYRLPGGTRVLCNPRGYGAENPAFRPDLVVEV